MVMDIHFTSLFDCVGQHRFVHSLDSPSTNAQSNEMHKTKPIQLST